MMCSLTIVTSSSRSSSSSMSMTSTPGVSMKGGAGGFVPEKNGAVTPWALWFLPISLVAVPIQGTDTDVMLLLLCTDCMR